MNCFVTVPARWLVRLRLPRVEDGMDHVQPLMAVLTSHPKLVHIPTPFLSFDICVSHNIHSAAPLLSPSRCTIYHLSATHRRTRM